MKHRKYTGEILKSATSGSFLVTRLKINAKYSSNDLTSWQKSKIKFRKNSKILDIGCGNGAQSIFMFQKISKNGSLRSIDFSSNSISILRNKIKGKNFKCMKVDMDNFDEYMDGKYDLIHSSYAIYYSSSPKKLLDECYKRINKNGKIILTVPCFPHTLVEEAHNINNVPLNVLQSLNFYNDFIKPFSKKRFTNIKVHNFKNILKISSKKDFQKIYSATTYFNKKTEKEFLKVFDKSFIKYGYLKIEKNAKMIILTK